MIGHVDVEPSPSGAAGTVPHITVTNLARAPRELNEACRVHLPEPTRQQAAN